ncbi:MAG TPA: DUF1573 domain-containing protein [Candidatus Paceibacterota bacterium]
MKQKYIVVILIGIAILGAFFWGYNKNAKIVSYNDEIGGSHLAKGLGVEASSGTLTASETLYDFGTISMKNGDVTNEFTVTNPTEQNIKIDTILTSCMCTRAYLVFPDGKTKGPFGMPGMGYVPPANETIEGGGTRVIRVVYDPNAHGPAGVGRIDRLVTLTDSSGNELKLEIKALVTP